MPDIINSSFDPRLPFPLDVRQQVQDMNALYAIPNTSRWEGMLVYVRSSETLYILKGGIDNSFWLALQFNGGGGLLPNGIVIYGEAQQAGNDILLNDAWVWRIDQVDYQSSDDVISITPAAAGNLRVDIIVGDNLGNFVKVVGTEVASPGPAIEPNIPADTVPLLRVDVNDTGITAFEEFALSAFVRFDIDNQGLLPSQQDNALKNINGVRKVGDDTRTGGLTNNGKVTIDLDEASSSLPILELYQQGVLKHLFSGEQARIIPHLLRVNEPISPTARGASFRGSVSGGDTIFEVQNSGGTKIMYIRGTGGIGQLRSNASDTSIRRDENYLTYPVSISGTGKLNDVALANGVGAIKFSSGVTEVSGIDANGDTKELLIWSDNPDGITLPAEDVLSIAANRFHREVNIPYQTWVKIVYDGDLARWVNGNTGELQETDARYFEVTSDVLTLKYILPDIAALQAFVRGPAVLAYVSDPDRGGYFNYVAEGDFVGTADFGISFPAQDGGYWVRDFEGATKVEWFKDSGDTDDLQAFQRACDSANVDELLVNDGDYVFSNTLVITRVIVIQGTGSAFSLKTKITTSSGFPAGASLIQFNNSPGRSAIRDISLVMDRRGGTVLEFNGEISNTIIERCHFRSVAAGYWGVDFKNPSGVNGVALINILGCWMYDFDGGGIKTDGGGDSCNILRNTFQLINSTSHILLWNGVSGAANLNFSENNATGASKFIEINSALQVKIMKNQLEATTLIDNAHGAMIMLGDSGAIMTGCTISDNNLNCYAAPNASKAIYLDIVQNCYIINNTIGGSPVHSVYADSLARKVTFFPGFTEGDVYDPSGHVAIIDGEGGTVLQGNLQITGKGSTGLKFGAVGANSNAFLDIDTPTSVTSGAATLRLFRNTNTTGGKALNLYKGDGTNSVQARLDGFGNSYLNVLSGNLGVGTNSPDAKIHIESLLEQIRFAYDSGKYCSIKINALGVVTLIPSPATGVDTDGSQVAIYSGAGTGTGESKLSFHTGTPEASGSTVQTVTPKVTILGNGNVGIGTTTPESKLTLRASPGTFLELLNAADSNFSHLIKSVFSTTEATNELSFDLATGSGTKDQAMKINGNGNVKARGKILATGGIGIGNDVAASSLGSVVKKMEVFDENGNSVGFVPIYDNIT